MTGVHLLLGAALIGGLVVAGCASATVTLGDRSATEQELVVRSLQRAVARLDTSSLEGRRATLDLRGLSKDTGFAREFLAAKLRARGVRVVDTGERADVELKAFALVMGVDQAETLIGIPSIQVPVVAIPIPEIALFKWNRNCGHSELEIYAFESGTGRLFDHVREAEGRSRFDMFKVLILVSFSWSDLEERPPVRDATPETAGGPTGRSSRVE